jgi:multidrug efflux pump subunit AcrA (membrane-fusion protein)
MKNRIYALALLFTAAALLVAGCSSLPIPTQAEPTAVPEPLEDFVPLVSATGEVVPEQQAQLSVATAGIIEEVLIEEGDIVETDQILVQLKGKEDLLAAIEAAEYELALAQRALDDLYENNAINRVNKLNDAAEAYELLRQAEYNDYYFSIPSNQEDLEMFEAAIAMRENLELARADYEPYKGTSQEYTYLDCDDVEVIKAFPALCGSTERYDVEDELEDAEADFKTAVDRIANVTNIALAQERLQEALEDYKILADGPDPKDIATTQARLDNAEASLAAAQALYDDLEVRAPFDGTVSELHINDSEWIAPGQPALEIADLEHLRIETTDLSEIDVARIAVGDTAMVTFDSLPGTTVTGTILRISPKASPGSGVNYTVVIELQEIPEQLRWGMTAFVDIEVE